MTDLPATWPTSHPDEIAALMKRRAARERDALDYAQQQVWSMVSGSELAINSMTLADLARRIDHVRRFGSYTVICWGDHGCRCQHPPSGKYHDRCIKCGAVLDPDDAALRPEVEVGP